MEINTKLLLLCKTIKKSFKCMTKKGYTGMGRPVQNNSKIEFFIVRVPYTF